MSDDDTPFQDIEKIRLLFFTSPTCFACPDVKKIVENIAGTSMKGMIHVSTIDITEEQEIAAQYGIMSVPVVMMNNERIAEGLITEDVIREKLWSQLLPNIISRDRDTRRKESMMILTKNTISSIISQELVRKNIGDYVHIGVYQQVMMSLQALDPLVPQLLYQSGQELGMYGAAPYYLTVLNPKVGAVKPEERFQETLIALAQLYSRNNLVPLYQATHCDIAKLEGYTATLRIYELANSAGAINIGETLCHYTAGEIAGTIEAMIGSATSVVETKCKGLGDEFCEFEIEVFQGKEPGKAPYRKFEVKDKDKKIKFLGDFPADEYRRQLFYEYIHETTQHGYNSLLMTEALRPNFRDYVHISSLQQQIMSLKFRDKFCGALLYSAGRELGVIGPGKNIIYDLLASETLPIESMKKATEMIQKYLTHPTNYLKREYSFVEVDDGEDEDEMILRIYENAYASGANLSETNLNETLCDFTAGYLAGRLALIVKDPPIVSEIKCHGTGHNYCEFKIEKGYSFEESEH
ncbi:MAG: thioredoxin family protein [Candidatus Heimdallarchaeota archaeon]|nr:thioredoxin family protein [Candidatus Heimdallarchaeota archaeon]MCK4955294.1 thioredoxin family protein [Candidatus Heimdallarchaeota archaeon]